MRLLFVTCVGFLAARWRRADLGHVNEWGLAGRRFGTWLTWFLIGGDIYTAYAFIAVPAAMFSTGSAGFFAFACTTPRRAPPTTPTRSWPAGTAS
jgi:SSS family solute:Na+ symporter